MKKSVSYLRNIKKRMIYRNFEKLEEKLNIKYATKFIQNRMKKTIKGNKMKKKIAIDRFWNLSMLFFVC